MNMKTVFTACVLLIALAAHATAQKAEDSASQTASIMQATAAPVPDLLEQTAIPGWFLAVVLPRGAGLLSNTPLASRKGTVFTPSSPLV
jgi:hypothetical protein